MSNNIEKETTAITLDYDKGIDIIPFFAEIIDKLEITDAIAEMIDNPQEGKKEATKAGLDFFIKKVFKNTKSVKSELFEIAAILEEKSVEDMKANPVSFWKVIKQFKGIFADKDFVDFFMNAIK